VTVLISFAISKTSVHEIVRNYARDHHFDMMTRAYDRPRPFKGENGMTVLRGRVMEAASTTIVVELFDGVSKSAFVSSTSEVFTIPTIGSDVVMVGKIVDERFYISKMRTILPGQEKGRRGPMPPFFDDMRGVSPSKNSF
jgi:hypothetical protein